MDDDGLDSGNIQRIDAPKSLTSFLRSIPAGAFEVDEKGNFLYCNQEAANILGYDSSEELMRKNIYDLYFDPEYRDDLLKRMRLHGGRMKTPNLQWRKKDGVEVIVNVFGEFVCDDNGKEMSSWDLC